MILYNEWFDMSLLYTLSTVVYDIIIIVYCFSFRLCFCDVRE